MANPVCELLTSQGELERVDDLNHGSAGAIVDFRGVVRLIEGGEPIRGIEYEAHPVMARHQLGVIGQEAIDRFGLQITIIRHRIGFVPVGQASLFARVAAAHRKEALQAMDWLVDELKKRVPIWKHPQFEETRNNATMSPTQMLPT